MNKLDKYTTPDTRPARGRCNRCHANMARQSPKDGYTDCGSCGYTNRPQPSAAGHRPNRTQRAAGVVKPRAVSSLTDAQVQHRLEEAPRHRH
jgi:hypothetical protein